MCFCVLSLCAQGLRDGGLFIIYLQQTVRLGRSSQKWSPASPFLPVAPRSAASVLPGPRTAPGLRVHREGVKSLEPRPAGGQGLEPAQLPEDLWSLPDAETHLGPPDAPAWHTSAKRRARHLEVAHPARPYGKFSFCPVLAASPWVTSSPAWGRSWRLLPRVCQCLV